MKHNLTIGILLYILLCILFPITGFAVDNLAEGFRKPPDEAKLWAYWWWLNGNVTEEAIVRDLEQMKEKGFGGVVLFDANGSNQDGNRNVTPGPTYASPEWIRLFECAVKEADRHGLSISLNIQSGWNLGGPCITPTHAAKHLVHSVTTVNGGKNVKVKLPQPKANLGYYKDVAVVAFKSRQAMGQLKLFDIKLAVKEFGGSAPDCRPLMEDEPHIPGEESANVDEVLVLTELMKENGEMAWNAPPGEWTVLRFGFTPTGARVSTSSADWQGLVMDYLSKDALDFYWEKAVKPVLEPVKKYCGQTVRYLHTDSWEAGGMNWTESFADEFRTRRGYDPVPYFPIIAGYIVNDRTVSNRFLNDFRRTIGDLIADNHYRYFQEKATGYGLGIHPESGGPHGAPIDSLQLLGLSDIPMSEYWCLSPRHRIGDANRFFTKQPASAAHTNGHKIVAAEGFTNIGMHWQESFAGNLKPSFDQAVCEGMNLLVWHAFTCSPDETGFPGQEYFAGTHFNPKSFTWKKSKDFLTYLNRVHFLLQQGLPSVDVLEYYGENVPNFTQRKGANTAQSFPGYDYDVASESVLLDQVKGVRDGRIVLKDGMNYRLLVLPNRSSLSLAALRKIDELVRAGATVLGSKPERTTGLDSDSELRAIADKLWSNLASTGRVVHDKTPHEFLKSQKVPFNFERIKGSHPSPRIDWIHRTLSKNQLEKVSLRKFSEFSPRDVGTVPADLDSGFGAKIYYIANLTKEPDDTVCAFRVVGRQPELWDPVSGERYDAPAFAQQEGTTLVPLSFAPYGSVFVLFRREIGQDVRGTATTNEKKLELLAELSRPWTVHFDPKWGGPQEAITFTTLESWSKHDNLAIRYYSGIAVYSQDVEVPQQNGKRVYLDIEKVCEMAEVKVNGQSCGTIWAAPYRIEITSALKPGKNRIEIEVANHWANRVIGDAAKPEKERLTKTNIQKLTAETPLSDSGLVRPIRLLMEAR